MVDLPEGFVIVESTGPGGGKRIPPTLAQDLAGLGFTSLYDASGKGNYNLQLMDNGINNLAEPAQLGSLPAPDTNDPWWIHDGTRRVIFSEAQVGDYVQATVPVIPEGAVTQIEAACLTNSDTPSVDRLTMGVESNVPRILYSTSRRLMLRQLRVGGSQYIGGAISLDPVPIDAPPRVWLRWKLDIATALCEYWWSPQQVRDFDAVTDWRSLGAAAGDNPGDTPRVVIGQRLVGVGHSGLAPADGEYLAAYWRFQTSDGDIIHQWDAEDLDRSNPDADHESGGTTWQIVRAS